MLRQAGGHPPASKSTLSLSISTFISAACLPAHVLQIFHR